MNKKDEYISDLLKAISKLKKASSNFLHNDNDNMRPSEEIFLMKIRMLSSNDWAKVSDLVNVLRLAPSTVSTILKALEERGYIVREKGKENRREVYVSLTDKGNIKLTSFKKNYLNKINDLITYLGEEDASKLIKILDKTVSFLEEQCEKEKENEKLN